MQFSLTYLFHPRNKSTLKLISGICILQIGNLYLSTKNARALAKLVGQRFHILQQLYPDKELCLTSLAEKTGLDPGNITRYVKKLETEELISIKENEKETGGKPYRNCSLTYSGREILEPFMKMERKNGAAPSSDEIKLSIEMLQEKGLTKDFRKFIAAKLSDLAIKHSDRLMEQDKAKELFKQTAQNPFPDDDNKIGNQLMCLLSNSIPGMLAQKKNREWFLQNIHPPLFTKISDENQILETRQWAIKIISRAVGLMNDVSYRGNVFEKFIEVYYANCSELSNTVKEELLKFEPNCRGEILKKISEQALSKPDRTAKAEALLKELFSLWWNTGPQELGLQNQQYNAR
jgi:DNA-binding MarR family transcriptional regulator